MNKDLAYLKMYVAPPNLKTWPRAWVSHQQARTVVMISKIGWLL